MRPRTNNSYRDRGWIGDDGKIYLCGTFVKSDCCGTATGHTMGCQGNKCLAAFKRYQKSYGKRTRWKRIKFSYVPAEPVRQHLIFLTENGVVQERIAEFVGVQRNCISFIKLGKRTKILRHNAEAIMSLHLGIEELFRDGRLYGWELSQSAKSKSDQRR